MEAFAACISATEINLRETSLQEIKKSTFIQCFNAKTIILPSTLTKIGVAAFKECKSCRSISFPDSLITIEPYAFTFCQNLQFVRIGGKKLSYIGDYAFSNCSSLHSAAIYNRYVKIGTQAIGYLMGNQKTYVTLFSTGNGGNVKAYANANGFNYSTMS